MADRIRSFADIIAPVTPDQFQRELRGRRHLHVAGAEDKFSSVFSWTAFNSLLAEATLWSSETLTLARVGTTLPPRDYCYPDRNRDGAMIMRPDRQRVMEHIRSGATLVLNLTESLDPGLAGVAAILQNVYGFPVKCNIYCSWEGRQGFTAHFDHTDVFVLHIAGRKQWNLYEGRYENPVTGTPFATGALSEEEHKRRHGAVIDRPELGPGDLLYIPRGQYHDALASTGASLHLTFGVVAATGLDLLDLIDRSLADDPLFRAPLPHFDDQNANAAHLGRLTARLAEIVAMPSTAEFMRSYQRTSVMTESASALDLPRHGRADVYLVQRRAYDRSLLPSGDADIAAWIVQRDLFRFDELIQAFPLLDPTQITETLSRLQELGLVALRE